MPKQLALEIENGSKSGYSVEVDTVDKESWNYVIKEFDDATINQIWSYCKARKFGKDNISHILVRKDNRVVAAVQTCITKTPVINAGFAHVSWGPLWKRHGFDNNVEDLREILGAMRRTYVDSRGLFLRIMPNETKQALNDLRPVFEDAGFKWHDNNKNKTLYLPLAEPLEQIRNNLGKSWRKNLIRAEKRGLGIVEGTDLGLFKDVVRLYQEMLVRKKFMPGISIDKYLMLQEGLPDYLKMQVMICQFDGKPVAGLVGSAIGDTGIELIAATGNEGLTLGASHLLRWKMVEYLKKSGCNFYNLNGIDPVRNPGGYQFKKGLSGEKGLDVELLGIFEACKNPLSNLAIRSLEAIRETYRKGLYLRHLLWRRLNQS